MAFTSWDEVPDDVKNQLLQQINSGGSPSKTSDSSTTQSGIDPGGFSAGGGSGGTPGAGSVSKAVPGGSSTSDGSTPAAPQPQQPWYASETDPQVRDLLSQLAAGDLSPGFASDVASQFQHNEMFPNMDANAVQKYGADTAPYLLPTFGGDPSMPSTGYSDSPGTSHAETAQQGQEMEALAKEYPFVAPHDPGFSWLNALELFGPVLAGPVAAAVAPELAAAGTTAEVASQAAGDAAAAGVIGSDVGQGIGTAVGGQTGGEIGGIVGGLAGGEGSGFFAGGAAPVDVGGGISAPAQIDAGGFSPIGSNPDIGGFSPAGSNPDFGMSPLPPGGYQSLIDQLNVPAAGAAGAAGASGSGANPANPTDTTAPAPGPQGSAPDAITTLANSYAPAQGVQIAANDSGVMSDAGGYLPAADASAAAAPTATTDAGVGAVGPDWGNMGMSDPVSPVSTADTAPFGGDQPIQGAINADNTPAAATQNASLAGGSDPSTSTLSQAKDWAKTLSPYVTPAIGAAGLLKQVTQGQTAAEKALASSAANATSIGNQLLTQGQAGTLSPGMQANVDQISQQMKAQVRGQYASLGLSGSTMEADALNSVDTKISGIVQQYSQNLMSTGQQILNTGTSAYADVASAELAADQALQQAIANFAGTAGISAGLTKKAA